MSLPCPLIGQYILQIFVDTFVSFNPLVLVLNKVKYSQNNDAKVFADLLLPEPGLIPLVVASSGVTSTSWSQTNLSVIPALAEYTA